MAEAHIYIDLPTHIDGMEAVWTLQKSVYEQPHTYQSYEPMNGRYVTRRASKTISSRYLILTIDSNSYSELIESLDDKAIKATSKILVDKYIENFREEILDNSERVVLLPPPKASTPNAPAIGTEKK